MVDVAAVWVPHGGDHEADQGAMQTLLDLRLAARTRAGEVGDSFALTGLGAHFARQAVCLTEPTAVSFMRQSTNDVLQMTMVEAIRRLSIAGSWLVSENCWLQESAASNS